MLRPEVWLFACLFGGVVTGAAAEPYWTYTVRPGDNLWTLGRVLLLDRDRWQALQRLNAIDAPARLRPGSRLKIPLDWLKIRPAAVIVEAVSGEVDYRPARGGEGVPLGRGDALVAGDTITTGTGAKAVLRFADGSRLDVLPESEVVLDAVDLIGNRAIVSARVTVERGRVGARVVPVPGGAAAFELWTGPATTAVRGTDLRVKLFDGGSATTTELLDGSAEVAASDVAETLSAGFGARTERGSPPSPPRPLLPAPELGDAPILLERLPPRLPVPPVEGAAAYRVELASDPELNRLVRDVVGKRPEVGLGDVPDGAYALAVRAIDADGIEGRTALGRVEIDARPAPPAPIAPGRRGKVREATPELRWAAIEGIDAYRVQLARDRGFARGMIELGRVAGDRAVAPEPLDLGPWWWRIAAIGGDETGPFSDPQPFTRVRPPDAAVAVERDGGGLVLRLAGAAPGQSFRFQLASDLKFAEIVLDLPSKEPFFAVPDLYPQVYWFRARVVDVDGYVGAFGPAQRIEIPPTARWPAYLALLPWLLLLF